MSQDDSSDSGATFSQSEKEFLSRCSAIKLKKNEDLNAFLHKVTHLHCSEKKISDIVRMIMCVAFVLCYIKCALHACAAGCYSVVPQSGRSISARQQHIHHWESSLSSAIGVSSMDWTCLLDGLLILVCTASYISNITTFFESKIWVGVKAFESCKSRPDWNVYRSLIVEHSRCLSYNHICRLENLQQLTTLAELDISFQDHSSSTPPSSDVSSFTFCPESLKLLYVLMTSSAADVVIVLIMWHCRSKCLKRLCLASSGVRSIEVLSALSHLVFLDLANNDISDSEVRLGAILFSHLCCTFFAVSQVKAI